VSSSDSFIGDIFAKEIPCEFENGQFCGPRISPKPKSHWIQDYNLLGQQIRM
jgi:hypothetical protein